MLLVLRTGFYLRYDCATVNQLHVVIVTEKKLDISVVSKILHDGHEFGGEFEILLLNAQGVDKLAKHSFRDVIGSGNLGQDFL